MSHHPPGWRRWQLGAAAAVTALVCGTTITAMAATDSPGHALPARARWSRAAIAGGPGTRPLLLINGDRLLARQLPGGGSVFAWPTAARPQGLVGLHLDGRNLEIPAGAVPYLGHGLAPSLFDLAALEHTESGGRLPVRVTFTGQRPVLPGVTVTRTGRRSEQGYLTATGAKLFGAALARQLAAGPARVGRGTDGLFPRGTQIALAGAPAPVPAARPRHTGALVPLAVTGTNMAGQPDTGGIVVVINADNLHTFEGERTFHNGTATFRVPAGHYWALGDFGGTSPEDPERLPVLPQFTVRHATTIAVDERAANSKISFSTPRPTLEVFTWFTLYRGGASGPPFRLFIENVGVPVYVSPTTQRPTVGTLRTYTEGQLISPPAAAGTPYAYNLDFAGKPGIIPAQHWTPVADSLTTVTERYYQDLPSVAFQCLIGGFAAQLAQITTRSALLTPCYSARLPGRPVGYFSGGPAIGWSSSYWEFEPDNSGGQADGGLADPNGMGFRTLPARRHLAVGWGAYPLHPQTDGQLISGPIARLFPIVPSAFRTGNKLTLYVTPFSDNYPGHLANGGPYPDTKVTSSYAIYQNGTEIAHGKPLSNSGESQGVQTARLSPAPSAIRFVLSARRSGRNFLLSPSSQTVWTWRSVRKPGATIPPGWFCTNHPGVQRCAVQPMMTLGYHVQGLALNGRAPAGPQMVGLDVGHIQPGAQPSITSATAEISFDGGRVWQPATVTAGSRGQFQITFTAPAKSDVTLRVHATDAVGGSVSETIQNAYSTTP